MKRSAQRTHEATPGRALLGAAGCVAVGACLGIVFGAVIIPTWDSDQPQSLGQYGSLLFYFAIAGAGAFAILTPIGVALWLTLARRLPRSWASAFGVGALVAMLAAYLYIDRGAWNLQPLAAATMFSIGGGLGAVAAWLIAYPRTT
jgi:hypothetical protein